MKNQKLCKEWSSRRDVPEDLWPEILFRLPVKSLLRFRSVSKSWLALIDDAEFSRLQLKNFRNNYDETHLLVVHNGRQNCVTPLIPIREQFIPIRPLKVGWVEIGKIVCSVDGLILLRRNSIGRFVDLMVWNPSIRKFYQVPSLSSKVDVAYDTNLTYVAIGLGYDTLANDYKIVKLVFKKGYTFRSATLHSVAIYTLGANSWKITKYQGKDGSSWSKWRWGLEHSHHRLYFRGCIYFMAGVTNLVFFDLSSEVFSSISLPDVRHSECEKLVLVDGSLTAFLYFRRRKLYVGVGYRVHELDETLHVQVEV